MCVSWLWKERGSIERRGLRKYFWGEKNLRKGLFECEMYFTVKYFNDHIWIIIKDFTNTKDALFPYTRPLSLFEISLPSPRQSITNQSKVWINLWLSSKSMMRCVNWTRQKNVLYWKWVHMLLRGCMKVQPSYWRIPCRDQNNKISNIALL